jgi:hypothetical protein
MNWPTPLGEDPADDAGHIRGRLGRQNPDEIAEQKVAFRNLAGGIDDEPGCGGGEHRFRHHQDDHHEERGREQIARQLHA